MIRFLLFLFFALITNISYADFSIIRDEEIEMTLKDLLSGLIRAADIDPDKFKIIIVNNKEVNAFVNGSSNIYYHTGLLSKFFDDPDVILAVCAHELAHLKFKHVSRRISEYNNTQKNSIISSMILGGLAFIASPVAVIPAISGSVHANERLALKYTRSQELAADQIAASLLEKSHNSSIGLKRAMEYFKSNLAEKEINPYSISHPLPSKRISFIDNFLKTSKYTNSEIPKNIRDRYIRSMIKLKAFSDNYSSEVLQYTKNKNLKIEYVYAQAIDFYKKKNFSQAIKKTNELVFIEPNNPFFHELNGQILFENGKVLDAISAFSKARKILPRPLINYEYAFALIEAIENKILPKTIIQEAIKILKNSELEDIDNFHVVCALAKAYGMAENIGSSNYYLAKRYLMLGDQKNAKKFAKIAIKYLDKSDVYYLKANDINEFASVKTVK